MARPKSVILSKQEKKDIVASLKAQIKAAKDNSKQIAGIRKEADKALTLANRAHLVAVKEYDKTTAAAGKTLASLEGQLAALTASVTA